MERHKPGGTGDSETVMAWERLQLGEEQVRPRGVGEIFFPFLFIVLIFIFCFGGE